MTIFTISPAVSGKTTWDLSVDGPLNLGTSGTWTIVPSSNFSVDSKIWGAGGGSGSQGATGGGGGSSAPGNGANGGSGVFYLSVPTAFYTGTTTGSPTVTTSGANTILKYTSSGSYTA